MYIINQHGILHSVPDDWAIPAGMRKATGEEISAFEATGEQETDREAAAKANKPNQTNTLGGGGTAGTMNQPADHGVHQPASQSGNTPANYSGDQHVKSTAAGGWAANPNKPVTARDAWETNPANPNPNAQDKIAEAEAAAAAERTWGDNPTAADAWKPTPANPQRPAKPATDTAKVTLPKGKGNNE